MWMEEKKELIREARAGGCRVCGEMELACLEFHHINPSEKEYTVSRMILTRVGVSTVQRELDKCICVCANCHLKIHAGIVSLI